MFQNCFSEADSDLYQTDPFPQLYHSRQLLCNGIGFVEQVGHQGGELPIKASKYEKRENYNHHEHVRHNFRFRLSKSLLTSKINSKRMFLTVILCDQSHTIFSNLHTCSFASSAFSPSSIPAKVSYNG